MLIEYRVNDAVKISIDLKDMKQCFQFIAYADSVLGVKRCGNCDSPNLSLVHRTPQGYDFYSVQCDDCHFELKFGQTKEGNKLYAKGWEEPYKGGESNDEGSQDPDYNKSSKGKSSNKPEPADDIPF